MELPVYRSLHIECVWPVSTNLSLARVIPRELQQSFNVWQARRVEEDPKIHWGKKFL